MKSGITFGGYLTFVEIGCGALCVTAWFVDRTNGRVIGAPVGGEEYPGLEYEMRPNSRLLKTEWLFSVIGDYTEGCMAQDFVWDGGKFTALNPAHKTRCRDH